MTVYVLLAVYSFVLFVVVRSAGTEDHLGYYVEAKPIRPIEYAWALGIILSVDAILYLTAEILIK